ncbi:Hypothetical protein CAP_7752 [Chondromyces apiculatus DSM 436]|uniref:Uncharacterized protein n=1 Tax=Chondromyces apiculatus DSM 436 TaxID=1192034 RepID=A0A017SXS3_9BACT|nr:Hypothetical protein CAP_7752 [Chondromyces apiculatus DSM 436]
MASSGRRRGRAASHGTGVGSYEGTFVPDPGAQEAAQPDAAGCATWRGGLRISRE